MKLRKNAGSKKREKSLGISRFLAVWLAKRLFPSLGSKLTCQYGRAAGYSPAAKIPPPAAGECEPTHLRPAQMPGRTVNPPADRKAPPEGGWFPGTNRGWPDIRLRRRFPRLRRGNANRRICARQNGGPPSQQKSHPGGLPGIRLRRRFPHLRRGNANRRICARRKCPAEQWAPQPTEKPPRRGGFSVGWGGRIRTDGCGSQSPVPYRLATPQNYRLL